jgi:hypothetical protein
MIRAEKMHVGIRQIGITINIPAMIMTGLILKVGKIIAGKKNAGKKNGEQKRNTKEDVNNERRKNGMHNKHTGMNKIGLNKKNEKSSHALMPNNSPSARRKEK